MPIQIKVDTGDFDRFRVKLEALNRRGIPHAMRNALNGIAFEAQVTWRREMDRRLVIRAKGFTTRTVRVVRAKGVDVRTMHSIVGSDADYMGGVEEGTTMTSKGKHGKPVPTGFASGEDGSRVPKRLPVSVNRLSNIELSNEGAGGKTDKQRRFLAIHMAAKKAGKNKYAIMRKLDGGIGIYKLMDSQRDSKGRFLKKGQRSGKGTIRPTLVWDLSRKSIRKKPHPTLKPALVRMERIAPRIMARELKKQITRHLSRMGA
jgi:hypothetical protein